MQKELSFFTLETNAEFKDATLSFSSVVFYSLSALQEDSDCRCRRSH